MKLTRKQHLFILNSKFDKSHYIWKSRRSLESLYKILIYLIDLYKIEIRELQKNMSKVENRKVKIQDRELVACSIAARSKKIGVFGTSHKLLNKSEYHKKILIALRPLGPLGALSNINNRNAIGKCAEIKAANNILKKDKKAQMKDIEFTTAIRPRTSEAMKRCTNCIEVFGNE